MLLSTLSNIVCLLLFAISLLFCVAGGARHSKCNHHRRDARKEHSKRPLSEREGALEDEQSQRAHDEEFSRRHPDSAPPAYHQSEVKSNEEQEDISVSSQRPPRPGIKSVRKKRRRTERERKKEQREQMAYKNRRRPVKLTLYQFIKQEVLHIRGNPHVIRRRKPKRVEREAVFRRVRRPTPSPPSDVFCMQHKKKKKPYVQFETHAAKVEAQADRGQDTTKQHSKKKHRTSRHRKSSSSKSSTSSYSIRRRASRCDQCLDDAIREVADDENISKEYDNLFPANDPIAKSKRESSEQHRLFKKKVLHRLKQLTHSESSSNRSCGRMNRAKSDNCKKPNSSSTKVADTSKRHLKDKIGQNENEEPSLASSVKDKVGTSTRKMKKAVEKEPNS